MSEREQLPWIGVDLDGTLAEYHGWSAEIGPPIPRMMERMYKWIHTPGLRVKIFTARAAMGTNAIVVVQQWLNKYNLPDLEVTNVKDMYMIELWDDRAIQVIKNTGIAIGVRE
jgi:hypothetical protein